MRILIIIFSLFSSVVCIGQEVNIGYTIGKSFSDNMYNTGVLLELSKNHLSPSINFAPEILFNDKIEGYNIPIFIEPKFGNTLKINPNIGLFIGNAKRRGIFGGLTVELNWKFNILFVKTDIIRTSYLEEHYFHFGGSTLDRMTNNSLSIKIGIKRKF